MFLFFNQDYFLIISWLFFLYIFKWKFKWKLVESLKFIFHKPYKFKTHWAIDVIEYRSMVFELNLFLVGWNVSFSIGIVFNYSLVIWVIAFTFLNSFYSKFQVYLVELLKAYVPQMLYIQDSLGSCLICPEYSIFVYIFDFLPKIISK